MKKLICLVLVLTFLLPFTACKKEKLATPQNVTVSDSGEITWDEVENANGYVVNVNGNEYQCETNSYKVSSVVNDFTYCVKAVAENFEDSDYSGEQTFKGKGTPKPPLPTYNIKVAISGSSEVKSGQQIQLKANVTGSVDKSITWSITKGSEYATISSSGLVEAKQVDGDKIIVVEARSKVDTKAYGEKVITILAKPKLTQEMLDAVSGEKVGFEGYLFISLYTFGLSQKLESTYTTAIKTAMNGTYWYAEYDNTGAGVTSALYYKNVEGTACQVGVNFMNQEEYFPMEEDDGSHTSWQKAGLYNSFSNVTVSDFTFDETEWRYVYTGGGNFASMVVSSANPYDFSTKSLSLIIDGDEILGVYAISNDDYSLSNGYLAIQELFVAIDIGESVAVPEIGKYAHEDIHDDLQVAINNMQALESYTLNFTETTASYLTTGYVESGFTEYVTNDTCLFRPYTLTYDTYGERVPNYTKNAEYGYKRINDGLYNSFYCDGANEQNQKQYYASRAYEKSFENAKASFAFAPEIFRSYYVNEETGAITYYVDEVMSPVASTFYYGVGNDINLYGIFAMNSGMISLTNTFNPYVVVKDGYIVEACFFFYMGSMYGVVEIEYSDFNTTKLPEDYQTIEFKTRNVPTSWAELTVYESSEGGSTEDDVEVNALEFLKKFFNDENIGEKMPFFGKSEVLGDTFGFGMSTFRLPGGSQSSKQCIVFYYDVPLDIDYTINSSLQAINDYLIELGFVKNSYDEYSKDGIVIAPVDSSLDLMIYAWKE